MHLNLNLHPDWKPIDQMALGLIYGGILVLSLLMALEESAGAPFRPAIVLFGSVFAITLAKAFSELLAHAIQTHERILTRQALALAWHRPYATLATANLPTLIMLAVGLGWVDLTTAIVVSQIFCVAILITMGARAGWAIRPRSWLPLGGAIFAGGIGSALAVLKYAIH